MSVLYRYSERERFKANCKSVQANLLRYTDGKQIISSPAAILRLWKISMKKLAQTHGLYLFVL